MYHAGRGRYDSGGSCTMVGEVDMTQMKLYHGQRCLYDSGEVVPW